MADPETRQSRAQKKLPRDARLRPENLFASNTVFDPVNRRGAPSITAMVRLNRTTHVLAVERCLGTLEFFEKLS
jgi:hypothetical protein